MHQIVVQHLQMHVLRKPGVRRISNSMVLCNHTSTYVTPVKLAYASYETTKITASSKHPILIMHGLFGSKSNWHSLSKAIHHKTDRKVIAVDARNHGDSPHSAEMSYKHMSTDLMQVLHDLGYEKAVLIGHSMGGAAVMYTALHFPKMVEKLVVVDMSPIRTSPSLLQMTNIFNAMRSVTFDRSLSLSKARKNVEEQLIPAVNQAQLRQFLTMNLVEAESGNYKWRVNLPVLQKVFATEIAKFPKVESRVFTGPTLFIGGSKSDYIKKEDHEAIKTLFPTAKFRYIEGADHWVHADKPLEFLDIAVGFINTDPEA